MTREKIIDLARDCKIIVVCDSFEEHLTDFYLVARNEALEEAADWFESAPIPNAFQIRDILRELKK